MDYQEKDPWDWTHKQPALAPLSNTLQVAPAQEAQPIQQTQQQDPLGDLIQSKVMSKGVDMAEKKVGTIWDAATAPTLPIAPAVEPIAATAEGALSQGIAPLAAQGATATGAEGLLGSIGPIGWGIGGILLARKLGLFR